MYQLFIRTWYKRNYTKYGKFSDRKGRKYDLVHHIGRKTIHGYANTYAEAQEKCRDYNDNIKGANELSRKMEFTSDY